MASASTRMSDGQHLSPREKIAQLVFVRIGSNMPPPRIVEQDEAHIAKFLETYPVGGLVLFNGGPATKKTLERLQAAVETPLLVGSDIERGVGQQVHGYTLLPHLMAFGQLVDKSIESVAAFARCIAEEARDAGIQIAFSPVADINTNPRNPIIATRAFGEDPQRVAELTRAFVEAAEAAGLCTTAKHFPGHGDTFQDSHDSHPMVDAPLEVLERRELVPFQAAIDAGCSLVMTAHVSYPALDPSCTPATFSQPILTERLRQRMGFQGLICSDSLLMAGARDRYGTEGELALTALQAGVDVLLDLQDPGSVIEYLTRCVEGGALDPATVDLAYERVQTLKRRVFGRPPRGQTQPDASSSTALSRKVARSAIRFIGDATSHLPLMASEPVTAILLKPYETHLERPEQPLADALRRRFNIVQYVQLGPKSDIAAYESAMTLARNAQQLVLAMIVRPAAWHAFGLRPEQAEFLQLVLAQRKDCVVASLGVPYVLDDYPESAVRICTFSDVPVSQEALADFLLNSAPARGFATS